MTDNCALLNEERENLPLVVFGVSGVSMMVFGKDWICNIIKFKHGDVGMVFHSTLESRRHLEQVKKYF